MRGTVVSFQLRSRLFLSPLLEKIHLSGPALKDPPGNLSTMILNAFLKQKKLLLGIKKAEPPHVNGSPAISEPNQGENQYRKDP